jgi:hypothetical protein
LLIKSGVEIYIHVLKKNNPYFYKEAINIFNISNLFKEKKMRYIVSARSKKTNEFISKGFSSYDEAMKVAITSVTEAIEAIGDRIVGEGREGLGEANKILNKLGISVYVSECKD